MTMFSNEVRRRRRGLRRMGRDDSGLAGVEFALILPMLFLLFSGSFTLFELFRSAERLESSTATMADIVSRQSVVDTDDLKLFHETFARLNGLDEDQVVLRVASLEHVTKKRGNGRGNGNQTSEMVVRWVFDSDDPDSDAEPADLRKENLPIIAVGDSVLVLQTWAESKTLFESLTDGLFERDQQATAIVRPRYVASIVNTDQQGD